MLPIAHRIKKGKKKQDLIRFILRRGKRIHLNYFICFYYKIKEADVIKYSEMSTKSYKLLSCIIIDKKVGNSIERHYIKRILENLLLTTIFKKITHNSSICLIIKPKQEAKNLLSNKKIFSILQKEINYLYAILRNNLNKPVKKQEKIQSYMNDKRK